MLSEKINKVADVLEKAAAYIEAVESDRIARESASKKAEATTLAEKVSQALGEDIDDRLVEKLSNLSPEARQLVSQLSGGDTVDSLGGPEVVKTASVRPLDSAQTSVDAASADFVNWLSN